MAYVCTTCGQSHDDVPLSFAADYPDQFAVLSPQDRENRAIVGSDQCIIDGEQFYIRGRLQIPIRDVDDFFVFGLWARVNERVYDEIDDCWLQEGKENLHGPFKGRIANSNAIYAEAFDLKITIRLQPVGMRPLFLVDERDHPMAVAQAEGITMSEAQTIVSQLLHPTP